MVPGGCMVSLVPCPFRGRVSQRGRVYPRKWHGIRDTLPHPPEQTNTCENITFPQLRLLNKPVSTKFCSSGSKEGGGTGDESPYRSEFFDRTPRRMDRGPWLTPPLRNPGSATVLVHNMHCCRGIFVNNFNGLIISMFKSKLNHDTKQPIWQQKHVVLFTT